MCILPAFLARPSCLSGTVMGLVCELLRMVPLDMQSTNLAQGRTCQPSSGFMFVTRVCHEGLLVLLQYLGSLACCSHSGMASLHAMVAPRTRVMSVLLTHPCVCQSHARPVTSQCGVARMQCTSTSSFVLYPVRGTEVSTMTCLRRRALKVEGASIAVRIASPSYGYQIYNLRCPPDKAGSGLQCGCTPSVDPVGLT